MNESKYPPFFDSTERRVPEGPEGSTPRGTDPTAQVGARGREGVPKKGVFFFSLLCLFVFLLWISLLLFFCFSFSEAKSKPNKDECLRDLPNFDK